MPVYLVKSNAAAVVPRFNGVNSLLVTANSAAEARAIARAKRDGDADAVWAEATVTEVVPDSDLEGWTFSIEISTIAEVFTHIGEADEDLADVFTALAALLNAHNDISGAGLSNGTFTVAAGANNLGDQTVTVTITPPDGLFPADYSLSNDIFIDSITDEGDAGDTLEIELVASPSVPTVGLAFRLPE